MRNWHGWSVWGRGEQLHVVNPPEMWIKKESAFEAVVPPDVFYIAQGIIRARGQRYTDEELIERLRTLFQSRGLAHYCLRPSRSTAAFS